MEKVKPYFRALINIHPLADNLFNAGINHSFKSLHLERKQEINGCFGVLEWHGEAIRVIFDKLAPVYEIRHRGPNPPYFALNHQSFLVTFLMLMTILKHLSHKCHKFLESLVFHSLISRGLIQLANFTYL